MDIYCDAFVARGRHELDSEPVVRIAPGVRGVSHIRLLVTDDSAYDRLVAEVASAQPGVVLVFDRASRCHGFLHEVDELVSYHLEQAVRYRTELDDIDPILIKRAGDQLTIAGRRALWRSDWRAAINLLERARTVTGPTELSAALEFDLANASALQERADLESLPFRIS
jgi:hypothetical protein